MLKLGILAGGLLHYSLIDIQKHAFPFIIAMHKYAVSILSSVSCILSMIACGNSADASSPCCILLQILPDVMVASCRAIFLRASLLPS